MKKTLAIIGVIALALTVTNSQAQTNTATNTVPILDNPNVVKFIAFEQGISGASNLTLAVYPSYAPDLINADGKKDQWGAGMALTYSFNGDLGQYLFTGLRLDYLGGELWAPSINGGLKADVQILGHNFIPFAYTGAVVPLQGAGSEDGEFGMLFGAGVTTTVWRGKLLGMDASFSVAAAVEKWQHFDGEVYHIAPVLTIKW